MPARIVSASKRLRQLVIEQSTPKPPPRQGLPLPDEVLLHIFRHLEVRDVARLTRTCRQFWQGPLTSMRATSWVDEVFRRRAELAGLATGDYRTLFVDAHGALLTCGQQLAQG